METELFGDAPSPGISLSLQAEGFLRSTARWGKFLAIVGFVITGLIILVGLFAGAIVSGLSGSTGVIPALGSGFVVTFSFIALLYLIPLFCLYKFSSKMSNGLDAKDEAVVAESLKNLKSLFKFAGIVMIIVLVLYALSIVFAAVGLGQMGM